MAAVVVVLWRLMLVLVLSTSDEIRCDSAADGSNDPVSTHLVAQQSASCSAKDRFAEPSLAI